MIELTMFIIGTLVVVGMAVSVLSFVAVAICLPFFWITSLFAKGEDS